MASHAGHFLRDETFDRWARELKQRQMQRQLQTVKPGKNPFNTESEQQEWNIPAVKMRIFETQAKTGSKALNCQWERCWQNKTTTTKNGQRVWRRVGAVFSEAARMIPLKGNRIWLSGLNPLSCHLREDPDPQHHAHKQLITLLGLGQPLCTLLSLTR